MSRNLGETVKSAIITWRCCNFHTSSHQTAKAGKVMGKIMGHSSKKRRHFGDSGILPSVSMFSKGTHEGRYSGSAKRASILNKLFMRHITDLMATGEYASEFVGHGIEINRVQITPDYKGLNVFWVAKSTQDDELVEKVLKKNAGFLRHELSTLHVMGVVPTIHFVKDKRFSQVVELDSRLAKADFGDYEPVPVETKLKTQLELYTPLPLDLKEKVQSMDKECAEDEGEEEVLPAMPQDVFGLNYADILNKVRRNMKKSEAVHRRSSFHGSQLEQTVNENPIEFSSNKEQREKFKSFLEKRELIRNKTRKLEKNYYPDLEYMREEMMQRRDEYFKNIDVYADDCDYVSDFEDEDDK